MSSINQAHKALLITLMLASLGCADVSSQETLPSKPISEEWKAYWYSGKAELTRYKLEQARYGEIHEGNAVLVFVTEDFLTDKQVKYERGSRDKLTSVLKLNNTRKFWTGIYPYSMISSVFTPVDGSLPTLKMASSTQEWCGHSYSQINLRDGQYEGVLHSYFQGEGDQEFSANQALLEDEIWSQIRLRPHDLPTGQIELIPGTQFLRLKHRDFGAVTATASLEETTGLSLSNEPLMKYKVVYSGFERTLEITFENAFPYSIVAWEETEGALTTRAVRTHRLNEPYWSQNSVADSVYRQRLGFD